MTNKFKIYRMIALMLLLIGLLLSSTYCTVFFSKDNGKHKGWYMNSNNPHHPNSTNPGKSKSGLK